MEGLEQKKQLKERYFIGTNYKTRAFKESSGGKFLCPIYQETFKKKPFALPMFP